MCFHVKKNIKPSKKSSRRSQYIYELYDEIDDIIRENKRLSTFPYKSKIIINNTFESCLEIAQSLR